MTPRYEVLSHTADTGFVAYGATLVELFENAAFAMFDLVFGIGNLVGAERVPVEVAASTVEDLLVDWLGTLLFEADTRDLAFCSFGIDRLGKERLAGWAVGIPSANLELSGPPIKAITYHGLSVEEVSGGYSATIVLDV